MSIMSLLANDNYIIVNRDIVNMVGLDEAVLLGELCSEYNYFKNTNQLTEDGFFYSTVDNVTEKTTFKEKKQRTLIKKLKDLNILEFEVRGLPAKRYIKINEETLVNMLILKDEDTKSVKNDDVSTFKMTELNHSNCSTNNNNINNNKNIILSKDNIISNSNSEFEFGKPKSKKKSLYEKCLDMISAYTQDEKLYKVLVDYLDYILEKSRNENKPFYSNTFKGQLNKLKELSGNSNDYAYNIVSQSICKCYFGFFPVSNYYSNDNSNEHKNSIQTYSMSEEEKLKLKAKDENGNLKYY